MFLRFPHLSRCAAPQHKWMETLLQRNKKDAIEYNASKNIVGDIFVLITTYQGAKHRSINR